MRNTARSHFVEVVVPAYNDFANHYVNRELGFRADSRYAALAAGALKDVPEHVAFDLADKEDYGSYASELRTKLWRTEPAYQIVCNYADCWKHRNLDRKDRLFDSLDDVQECIATTRYEDQQGPYYFSRKLVEIKLKNGTFVDLGRAIKISYDIVAEKLFVLGQIPAIPRVGELLPIHPMRDDERFQGEILLLGEVGEKYSAQFRYFIYRNGSDLNEPNEEHRFGSCEIACKSVIRESPFKN